MRFALCLSAALTLTLVAGCSSSHSTTEPGTDGGTMIMFDADIRGDAGPPPPECGNGTLEAGEMCDDGNTMPGDGCTATCAREAYCGNRMVDMGEVCDDGNNRSADGCRSDCRSTEICGNMIVDYAVGEVCDSTPGCDSGCRMIMGCGDMMLTSPEECDDGNMSRWDGCGADCRDEISMLMENLEIAGMGRGCDFSGDGVPDNGFARALGPGRALINMLLGGGGGGGVTILLSYLGLDDRAGVNDPSLRVAWLTGAATMTPGEYLVDMGALNGDGSPATSIESRITMRRLDGGPEDLFLPIGFFPIELAQGRVRAETVATGGELSGLDDGVVCGVVPESLFGGLSASLLEMLGGGGGFMIDIGPGCDDAMTEPSFADLFIGGGQIAIVRLAPTPPDVDLDGDGLESFVVDSMGPDGCQPVVTACIDGDGTVIEGHDCLTDPRIADGYSAAIDFTATRVSIVGIDGAIPPPMP